MKILTRAVPQPFHGPSIASGVAQNVISRKIRNLILEDTERPQKQVIELKTIPKMIFAAPSLNLRTVVINFGSKLEIITLNKHAKLVQLT